MRNFKIKVNPEQSEVIQKLLFIAGYSWSGFYNLHTVQFKYSRYLFLDYGRLCQSNDENTYVTANNIEITFDEFITELEIELNEKFQN